MKTCLKTLEITANNFLIFLKCLRSFFQSYLFLQKTVKTKSNHQLIGKEFIEYRLSVDEQELEYIQKRATEMVKGIENRVMKSG